MISIGVFNVLIAVAVLLFVYGLVDLGNRIYGNIISAVISTVLFGYAAVIANTGILYDGENMVKDLSLQIVLIIVTAIAMVYTAYMVWEARAELNAMED